MTFILYFALLNTGNSRNTAKHELATAFFKKFIYYQKCWLANDHINVLVFKSVRNGRHVNTIFLQYP
jgi:hypothetical protein